MPGSNEYSVSPDVRTNTSESKPTLISKSNPTPETYQMQDYHIDKNIDILYQFFKYARYGKQGTSGNNYLDGITPNMIYEIKEIWSSWGQVEVETFKAKVVESIDIENTESDALTITIPFQVQGDNN